MREGTVHLPLPIVGLPAPHDPAPLRITLQLHGVERTVWVLDVGLACCSVELMAAVMGRSDAIRDGVLPVAPGPQHADVLVVAGTCTDALAPALKRLYDSLPEPKRVVSYGACAGSGGPYWDSYSVTKGVDQLVPVDVYVPGCPPRPEALLEGILALPPQGVAS
jgi:NADH-quinone oxidoreductase subunit B